MDIISIIGSKPVLIGLHLGFAIIGIDAFIWYAIEVKNGNHKKILKPLIGVASFLASWFFGGFYYVNYYGSLVKPVIKEGLAPWAHTIAMETKEHIFLFIIPAALTVMFAVYLSNKDFSDERLKRKIIILSWLVAGLGLAIGAFGFIVSAAARWGAI